MNDLKNAIKNYKNAIADADAADAAWEKDPSNFKLEAAFDAAYEKQNEAMLALRDCIVEFTNGAINSMNARFIVAFNLDDIERIISLSA